MKSVSWFYAGMDKEAHRAAIENFFGLDMAEGISTKVGGLQEALYAMSELNLWSDAVDSVSAEQAIECWMIVQKLMECKNFPDNLRM